MEHFLTLDQVRAVLRSACDGAGGKSAFARAHGISRTYVMNVLSGAVLPGEKVLAALGYEKVVLYRRKERG